MRSMHILALALFLLQCNASLAEEEAAGELAPLVVTARGGFAEPLSKTPWSVSSLDTGSLSVHARTMPEALTGLPSVMVQKTALGQSSPYLRGLTGYHNVLLVDGIRVNHSAMRSGPNQYWSTVELLGAGRLELIRGPHGIKHGADAIGGVVNVLSAKPFFTNKGNQTDGQLFTRFSSAESSWMGRLSGQVATPEWFAEASHAERSFGDLEGGRNVGAQRDTGYDSRGTNLRLARKLSDDSRLVFGLQRVFMDDVPRTHKTVNGLSWKGLSPGSELWRRLDQERRLAYGRLSWDDKGGLADSGSVTLNLHTHEQDRNRMKTSGGEIQRFDLNDVGISSRFESDGPGNGRLAYGAEFHRESLTSSAYKVKTDQSFDETLTQGPLAADADYNRLAFYLSNTFETESGLILEPGVRYSQVEVDVDKWYKSTANGTALENPFSKEYDELVGSLRISKKLNEKKFVFAGLSQGFRPPSLYDLTSTDETSVEETPDIKLESEGFLQAEIGIRGQSAALDWNISVYRTWIDDMIVRSPKNATGSTMIKANGDGYVEGIEVNLHYEWNKEWQSKVAFSWIDAEVEQLLLDASGSVAVDGSNYSAIDRAPDRLMPTQLHLVTSYRPTGSDWWAEGTALAVGDGDRLSLKDERDTSRIPGDGTPGYLLFGLRAGKTLGEDSSVFLAAENLGDVDYRVHGSGLNGPGRNFVLSFQQSF
jgi:hemoglobin/transferrin/lactoferrin receptor protein